MCQRTENRIHLGTKPPKQKLEIEELAPGSLVAKGKNFEAHTVFLEETKPLRMKKTQKILQTKKKGLPIPPGVTFFYYGRPTKLRSELAGARGHQGVVTVAMGLSESSPERIILGLSFCSTEDAFCKVTGRDLALQRLFDDPVVIPYLDEPQKMARQVVALLITREFKKLSQFGVVMPTDIERLVPGWAKDLAKSMQKRQSFKKPTRLSVDHSMDAAAYLIEAMKALNEPQKYQPGGAPIRIISIARHLDELSAQLGGK
jgi:hypothetical protein